MTVITEVEGQRLLREDVAAARLPRDVVRATGEDALDYLQGQLSQDLAALGPGAATYSLVLEPAGKVDAWVRLWRADEDAGGFLLEVEAGAGEALVARLERFRLRVQVELELLRWSLVAVRGPATPPVEQLAPAAGEGGFATAVDWAGLPGVDLLGEHAAVPDGVPEVDAAALDAVRIEAGRPAMGSELGPDLEPKVIPAEAGEWLVEQSVSFTKGCYTGQELVARVDSRGSNTPRKLRGLVVRGDVVPEPGTPVVVDGRERGMVTSAARSAALGAPVALAYVHRSVEPGATARLGEGPEAVVQALPLVQGPLAGG